MTQYLLLFTMRVLNLLSRILVKSNQEDPGH